jgi:tRNA(Ile)-lysidine synthase TilS/MesJ
MPETVPGITFDEEGICSLCLNYQKEKYLGEEELERAIVSTRKEDNRYDCIVPLSGGRDSTYILYMAKAIYGLKVLALSYDNEFRTDQALVNMKNACKRLDVDFVSVRSKRDIAQRIVKNAIRSSVSFGESGFCRACCYGCRSVVYRAAEQYKVPLILWGESKPEATQDAELEAFEKLGPHRSKFLKLLNISFYKVEYLSLLQRLEFHVSGNSILSRGDPSLKDEDIREIRVFDYVPWDRGRIKETITGELGWQKPHGHIVIGHFL